MHSCLQGSESEARSEPPYMFRPVQNPDDEEAEGRVRTRTRTKELVIMSPFRFVKSCFGCVCRVVVFSSFMLMCAHSCTMCMLGIEAPHKAF